MAHDAAPNGVQLIKTDGVAAPAGLWNVAARAGDFLFIGGMRGIDPATNKLVSGDKARVARAFENMAYVARTEGATLDDCVRLVIYVTDMARVRPLVNQVQDALWQPGRHPPRTIVEVRALPRGDTIQVEGTFYLPVHSAADR
ncbi:MAG: RidA family protein [Alphaproteobacteria bacterium]|nr:RidA family protein [Alphaproteobacteria bacterium]